MRKLSYASLLPHLKDKVSEHDYMPFPWEEEIIAIQTEKTNEELASDLQQVKDYWARIDELRGKKPEC